MPRTPRTPRPTELGARAAYDQAWQRRMYDSGWAGIAWPRAHGGRGATLMEQLVWCEEYARAGAPDISTLFVGLNHAGPTLVACGTEEQKAAHLAPILRGEVIWCQGFSEPNAGSDLASLQTRAVVEGDVLVVSGQKVWTSFAHVAQFQELLVRTDPEAPRHRGITWVICPMDAPGIEIRPITTLTARATSARSSTTTAAQHRSDAAPGRRALRRDRRRAARRRRGGVARAGDPARCRRGARRGRAHARGLGRVRQGAAAVRPADRLLPGGEAPLRQHGRARRGGTLAHHLRGGRARRGRGGRAPPRRRRQGARDGRRARQRGRQRPEARRHGLHLGGGRAPPSQARLAPRARPRDARRAPGRARCPLAGGV